MHSFREVRSIYRFGIFELEAHTGELRRNGLKLRLQEQPYQVLLKLLEHAGQIVTREELLSALWPADTFVEFEPGLNTTIKRLRDTLRDGRAKFFNFKHLVLQPAQSVCCSTFSRCASGEGQLSYELKSCTFFRTNVGAPASCSVLTWMKSAPDTSSKTNPGRKSSLL
jgi:hypothetical protein